MSRHRRRVSVVRWADLAAVTEDMFQDEDGVWHSQPASSLTGWTQIGPAPALALAPASHAESQGMPG